MGVTRPRWSDSQGKTAQPLEAFEPPPPGWEWDGEWFISPDLRLDNSRWVGTILALVAHISVHLCFYTLS